MHFCPQRVRKVTARGSTEKGTKTEWKVRVGVSSCPLLRRRNQLQKVTQIQQFSRATSIGSLPPKNLGKSRGPPQNPRPRRAVWETPAEPSERQISSESLAEGCAPRMVTLRNLKKREGQTRQPWNTEEEKKRNSNQEQLTNQWKQRKHKTKPNRTTHKGETTTALTKQMSNNTNKIFERIAAPLSNLWTQKSGPFRKPTAHISISIYIYIFIHARCEVRFWTKGSGRKWKLGWEGWGFGRLRLRWDGLNGHLTSPSPSIFLWFRSCILVFL